MFIDHHLLNIWEVRSEVNTWENLKQDDMIIRDCLFQKPYENPNNLPGRTFNLNH